jgi:hypothetical protein
MSQGCHDDAIGTANPGVMWTNKNGRVITLEIRIGPDAATSGPIEAARQPGTSFRSLEPGLLDNNSM